MSTNKFCVACISWQICLDHFSDVTPPVYLFVHLSVHQNQLKTADTRVPLSTLVLLIWRGQLYCLYFFHKWQICKWSMKSSVMETITKTNCCFQASKVLWGDINVGEGINKWNYHMKLHVSSLIKLLRVFVYDTLVI